MSMQTISGEVSTNESESLVAVPCFANDPDIGAALKQGAQGFTEHPVIIDKQNAQGHGWWLLILDLDMNSGAFSQAGVDHEGASCKLGGFGAC